MRRKVSWRLVIGSAIFLTAIAVAVLWFAPDDPVVQTPDPLNQIYKYYAKQWAKSDSIWVERDKRYAEVVDSVYVLPHDSVVRRSVNLKTDRPLRFRGNLLTTICDTIRVGNYWQHIKRVGHHWEYVK